MKDWWVTNVAAADDAATFVSGISVATPGVGKFGGGNSRLASHNYDTLSGLYSLADTQVIIPCKAAWNEGATFHMDNKPAAEAVTHAGAGGDNEEFNESFNDMASALGDPGSKFIGIPENLQAGGDENLEERVAALEAKLEYLENSKAGGGKTCHDCCTFHIGGNNPTSANDGADAAALTKAKQENAKILGNCQSSCNGTKANWTLGILKCCHGNTEGHC